MSSIGNISTSNMQFLIQQATQTAQANKSAKAPAGSNQASFADAVQKVSGPGNASSANDLSSVTMASLAGGTAAGNAVASSNAASLLNIVV